jgi:predicted lipoprotein with Yx(FWY)xxD motif
MIPVLYLLNADSGPKSPWATAWPTLPATGTPTASTRLTASKLATITRSGGSRRVTHNGHSFYLYADEKQHGDVNGQGVTAFAAGWFALTPAVTQISAQPPSSGGGASSGGGGASAY